MKTLLPGVAVLDKRRMRADARRYLARLKVDIADTRLYEGQGRGSLVIDARAAEPHVALSLTADGIDALPLLRDTAGIDLVSGRGKLIVALTATGSSEKRLADSLAGKADIALLAARAAYKEKKPLKGPLMALIKAEFTSLETDDARYSYALKGYFSALAEALKQKDAR